MPQPCPQQAEDASVCMVIDIKTSQSMKKESSKIKRCIHGHEVPQRRGVPNSNEMEIRPNLISGTIIWGKWSDGGQRQWIYSSSDQDFDLRVDKGMGWTRRVKQESCEIITCSTLQSLILVLLSYFSRVEMN